MRTPEHCDIVTRLRRAILSATPTFCGVLPIRQHEARALNEEAAPSTPPGGTAPADPPSGTADGTGSGAGSSRGAGSPSGGPRPLGTQFGRTRDAFMRLVSAHLDLLKAELAVTGREIGIIIGLAVAAIALALLIVTLLYVGTALFLGEWLFGSMAWGILHGTLFTIAIIVPIGLNLAGGWMGAWVRGAVLGALVTVGLSLLFGVNLARNAAVAAGEQLEVSLALEPAVLPTLVGVIAGALVVGLGLFVLGLRAGGAFKQLLLGAVVGGILGAILGSVMFDWQGAVAVALTFGLIAWIGISIYLAWKRGFDPQARYDPLVPRESMAALEHTKTFLTKLYQRQRRKVMGG
jgi:hypothetical protein